MPTHSSTVTLSLDVLVEVVFRVESEVADTAEEIKLLIGDPLYNAIMRARVLML